MASKTVTISPIRPQITTVPILGHNLLMHAWSKKAIKQMEDKQQKRAGKVREAKDPEALWRASRYVAGHDDKILGAPCGAFRKAVIRASSLHGFKMTEMRQCLFLKEDFPIVDGRGTMPGIRIFGEAEMHMSTVRLSTKVADIRYRALVPKWGALLVVEHLPEVTPDQVVNLINAAGFSVGILDWRPERDGEFGRWQVVSLDTLFEAFPNDKYLQELRREG